MFIGSRVNMVLSKGPESVAVPDVVGKAQADAEAALKGGGLVVGIVTQEYNATIPAGRVISQSPAAGTSVKHGSAVSLAVSKGPEPQPVAVPDVVGKAQADAGAVLTGAGLVVGTVTEAYHATIPAGSVISQSPAAGSSVLPGSQVDLVVSKGPEPGPVAVPDVVGRPLAEAEAALISAGLVVGKVTEAQHDTIPFGRVISQSPAAGTNTTSGSAVDLVVSHHRPRIRISTIEELQRIGNDTDYPLNGRYILTKDIDASATATWNGGKGFSPIGDRNAPFMGVFQGDGCVISNLVINQPGSGYMGLFRYVGQDAEIWSLTLADGTITGDRFVGSLAGYNEGGIYNCSAEDTEVHGDEIVGGLIGVNSGDVQISWVSDSVVSGVDRVGGFVGRNEPGAYIRKSLVQNSSISGDTNVGGFVGSSYSGHIEDSGVQDSIISGDEYVGGFAGRNEIDAYIRDSWVQDSSISGENYVGGLVGEHSSYNFIGGSWVQDSIVSGESYVGGLVGDSKGHAGLSRVQDSSISGNEYVGGLVGINHYGEVFTSSVQGSSISGESDVGGLVGWTGQYTYVGSSFVSDSNITGAESVGGLVGTNAGGKTHYSVVRDSDVRAGLGARTYFGGMVGESWGEVEGCTSDCRVLCDESGPSQNANLIDNVGGLIGFARDCKIVKCASLGPVAGRSAVGGLVGSMHGATSIKYCYATGDVHASSNSGGLTGSGEGTCTVTECYSVGFVDCGGDSTCGALAGVSDSGGFPAVTASFWNKETSGFLTSFGGGEGRTTSELKQKATFTAAGWDFVDEWSTWLIDEGLSYPYFRFTTYPWYP
jgi:beta-lactam-binding protein with PASTA domain